MTKPELIAKYWKKKEPGREGFYNPKLIEREWEKDTDPQKIKKKDLDDLLEDLKINGKSN